MNYFIKTLFLFFLLTTSHTLYGMKPCIASSDNLANYELKPSSLQQEMLINGYCKLYNIPTDVNLLIRYFVYDNVLKYKNKTLPDNLSEQDLSSFDFTNCQFTYTNLTNTNLTNVILIGTTCNYLKAFKKNIKLNKVNGGIWYQENLPKDLQSIAQVYPKLENNKQKAKLLHIACGLSLLPFCQSFEFHIKVQYWSCALLQVKQAIQNESYRNELVCSLEHDLNCNVQKYCWKTDYPQNEVNINAKMSETNIALYLKHFLDGFSQHKCAPGDEGDKLGTYWHKNRVQGSIGGLQQAYSKIKEKQLQQEAHNIAHALSKSYQIGQWNFLKHYLFYQNCLIRLRRLVDKDAKKWIKYTPPVFSNGQHSWIISKK